MTIIKDDEDINKLQFEKSGKHHKIVFFFNF